MGRGYKPHLYEVGEVVNGNLKIVDKIWIAGTKRELKAYIVQSLVYPNAPTYETREQNITRGVGCAYLAGRKVCEENSLWNIDSIRGNIIDVEEAKKVTPYSHKKITFKCSYKDCSNTKTMKVQTLSTQGYTCPHCSTGISYAERFGLAINQYFNLGFEYQQQYKDGRFDFINYKTKVIIEMNGRQHYEDTSWEGSHETTVESDNKKRKWAKENGYTIIFIDARKSEFEFIKDNINNCKLLPNIKDEDIKPILEIIKKHSAYDIENIVKLYTIDRLSLDDIGSKYKVSRGVIKSVLDKQGINFHDRRFKGAIRCVETKKVYNSMTEAMKKTGIDRRNIGQCLSGRTKTAGGFHWEYVEEG